MPPELPGPDHLQPHLDAIPLDRVRGSTQQENHDGHAERFDPPRP